MSAVVGGLAYGAAQQKCEQTKEEFRLLAQDECMANDPSDLMKLEPKTVDEEVSKWKRLQSLHRICAYAMTDLHETAVKSQPVSDHA